MRKSSWPGAGDGGEAMNKLNRFLFVVSAFILVTGIANVSLARQSKRSKTSEETIKIEPEVIALHYESPGLDITTRAEKEEDDTLDDAPLWAQILFSGVTEDPDAKYAELIENLWEDPIEEVKQGFVSSLEADLGLTNIRSIEKSQKRDNHKVNRLQRVFPETAILDFITNSISFVPKTLSSSRYRLGYKAEARLIQPQKSRPIWSENCSYAGTARRLETFLNEDGALLKEDLESAAQVCAEKLYSRFVEEINPA